jgi:hypothetical protein
LLDYEDRTTITVVRTDTKAAAEGLNINISDFWKQCAPLVQS